MTIGVATARRIEQEFPDCRRWLLAYSGGLDSQVLLHLLATYLSQRGGQAASLLAIHVNHGLQADAGDWQAHCAQSCHDLNVAFQAERVEVARGTGIGLERAAREARYAVFESHVAPGDLLLQAHHQDDQAETVLLRMLRGAGPAGIGGIPRQRPLGRGTLLRPLLNIPRSELHDYAARHGLRWVEDGSNAVAVQDRNFLRLEVLPLLHQRWPDVAAKLCRTADSSREVAELAVTLAREDLGGRTGKDRFAQHHLDVTGLEAMPPPRRRNLLRQWLKDSAALTPSHAQLDRIESDLLAARPDAKPRLRLGDWDLRRYQLRLYLLRRSGPPPEDAAIPLEVPGWNDLGNAGRLQLRPSRGVGLRPGSHAEVRFRSGPLTCRLAGAGVSRSLKRQLQILGVPPWLRRYLPLVYVDGNLVALADLAVCEGGAAAPDETGLEIRWQYPSN